VNASNPPEKIVLSAYRKGNRVIYELNLQDKHVVTIKKETLPKHPVQTSGFGEYVSRSRSQQEREFVALFVNDKTICLLLGRELFEINDETNATWFKQPSRLFSIFDKSAGRRRLELHQAGQLRKIFEYVYRDSNYWEDDDGDIIWWIERQLKTPQNRCEFLNFWPHTNGSALGHGKG